MHEQKLTAQHIAHELLWPSLTSWKRKLQTFPFLSQRETLNKNQPENMEEDRLRNLPDSLLSEVLLNLPKKNVVKTSMLSSRWKKLWRFVPGLNLNFILSPRETLNKNQPENMEEDRLRNLPDSLIFEVFLNFLNFRTKDVVKTSVLSRRWRYLWRDMPGLDLNFEDFPNYNTLVSFVDRFLDYNSESYLQYFKLDNKRTGQAVLDNAHVARWINIVVKKKVQHLHVLDCVHFDNFTRIPPTAYTCDSLVSLKLRNVKLPSQEFVSLPSLKDITLIRVNYANDLAFEILISSCPVLETLTLCRGSFSNLKVLRVCSQSLLRLIHSDYIISNNHDLVVAIDAPRLEYLSLHDHETENFVINNTGSLVDVDIDISERYYEFDLPKREMIQNFFVGISSLKNLVISEPTLKVLYYYSKPIPLFRNLSSLRVTDYDWPMLLVFLESCPNLKSLDLESTDLESEGTSTILSERPCFLSSLDYVVIKSSKKKPMEMKLVSYFLENSTILKKLTLCLGDSEKRVASLVLEKLHTIPRLSTACHVVVQKLC